MDNEKVTTILKGIVAADERVVGCIETEGGKNLMLVVQKKSQARFWLLRVAQEKGYSLDKIYTLPCDDPLKEEQLQELLAWKYDQAEFWKMTLPVYGYLKEVADYCKKALLYFDFRAYVTSREDFAYPEKPSLTIKHKLLKGYLSKGLIQENVTADNEEILEVTAVGQLILEIYENQYLAKVISTIPKVRYNFLPSENPLIVARENQTYLITMGHKLDHCVYEQIEAHEEAMPQNRQRQDIKVSLLNNRYIVLVDYFDWTIQREVCRKFRLVKGYLSELSACYAVINELSPVSRQDVYYR